MPYPSLVEVLLPAVCLPDQQFQISLFSPFDYYKHFILLNKALDVSNYKFVLQLFKKLDFLHALFPLLLIIHVEDLSAIYSSIIDTYLDQLQRYLSVVRQTDGLEDHGELALA
jgi:hypothetical protein